MCRKRWALNRMTGLIWGLYLELGRNGAEGVPPPRRDVQDNGGLQMSESPLPPRGPRVAPHIFTEPRSENRSSDRHSPDCGLQRTFW